MRGRANKVTKPKRTSRTPSAVPESVPQGVDYLAAAAHAHQLGNHQALHDGDDEQPHDHDHDDGGPDHDHDPGAGGGDHHQQQDQDLYPDPSDPVDHAHHRQLGLDPDVHAAGVATAADPAIHPDLQAFGSAAAHAHFALAHQDMDAQMQDPVADAPPPSAPTGKVVPGLSTAAEFAKESGYDNLDLDQTASTLSRRLMSQPGRRLASQRRKEQKLNLVRRSNVEALLAHVSGQQAASACKNCHKGHGPWTSCVVVDGQMCGSCANCWYNASGARCSFHGMFYVHPPNPLPLYVGDGGLLRQLEKDAVR